MATSSTRFPSNSTMRSSDESEQGLFPPPLSTTLSPPPSSLENPHPGQAIMNQRATADSSLYQICMNLRRRLAEVPNFEEHMAEMEEEEAENNDTLDPVSLMWNCLRRGYPLMTIYNALRPRDPLDVDSNKVKKTQVGKAATFKFLQACMENLKIPAGECFLITDLYGEDTTGFVKVTKLVNRVLDTLKSKGLLQYRGPARNAATQAAPLTVRERIIDEVVKTERDYVQHLETLQSFQNAIQGAVPGDAMHDIFLNLNQLLDFQRRFLIRIEQQNSLSEPDQNWGKLFSHYRDGFKVYEPFLANQTRCNNAVMKEWKKLRGAIPPTSELVGMVDSPTILLGFLIKPFQRLSKYPLLLKELETKGDYDPERKEDLVAGYAAAQSIMDRADAAIGKENRLEAVNELSYRVEDWKGHKIDHFGELLLFGAYTVLKGEGAKEVEREVRVIFDSLDPLSRALIVAAGPRVPRLVIQSKCNAATLHAISLWFIRTMPRTSSFELHGIPEEPEDGEQHVPLLLETPSKRAKFTRMLTRAKTLESSPRAKSPPQTPRSTTPTQGTPQGTPPRSTSRRGSPPQTPESTSLRFKHTNNKAHDLLGVLEPSGLASPMPVPLADTKVSFSQKLKQFPPISSKPPENSPTYPPVWEEDIYTSMQEPSHLLQFNGVFKHSTSLLFSHIPFCASTHSLLSDLENRIVASPDKSHSVDDDLFEPIEPTILEKKILEQADADNKALERPLNEQYKVYLFERILLCCKEINPNKPKNKMLSTTKPLVDRKGKPKLQLKGRIFMQNVTDVVTLNRRDQQSFTLQIFWKGDPGVENFVIRFTDEVTMKKWQETVQAQKKHLNENQRGSGQTGTSATEFSYLKSQPAQENPYREAEEVDDDDLSSNRTIGQSKSMFSMSRNASSNSLRSMQTARTAPPKYAPSEQGNGIYAPSLSLNTNIPPGGDSPGEFAGNSYFSPSNESPVSTRSSSQQSMYPFPAAAQMGNERYIREDNKHRTAPAIGRAPSREGPPGPPNSYTVNGRTVTRPSLPPMAASQYPQQQLASMQNRSRSASTPDIHNANVPGGRRQGNGLYPQTENVPVPPIPAHMAQMRVPINRSQTASPLDGGIPIRSATQSPAMHRDRGPRHYQDQLNYDQQGQRMQPITEPLHDSYDNMSMPLAQDVTSPAESDGGIPYPAQLKVKIHFDDNHGHVTIVVPTSIKHRSLIDRIDSKMVKVSTASIAKGTARLRYKDSDGDIVTIRSDEDVHLAIEDWGTENEDSIRAGSTPDFQLTWHQNKGT
ncbi:cell division control protein 24, partial [Lecanoromycetidae sp. Uapishka_2]